MIFFYDFMILCWFKHLMIEWKLIEDRWIQLLTALELRGKVLCKLGPRAVNIELAAVQPYIGYDINF